MSVRRQALRYTAAAIAIAALVIVASTYYLNPALGSAGQQGGTPAKLIIQLTDPPQVPHGTLWLNITYSSIGLLVAEPAGGGQFTTTTVAVIPSGGSATVDLLQLQNIAQTIASASLPTGTTIYSFSFTKTSINIDVSGTQYGVTLATGGSTLIVTLAKPATLQGTDIALLELNPVIVSTPTGYQMIPSAVGVVKAESQGEQNQEHIGNQQQLTTGDKDELNQVHGSVSATLTAFSVSGDTTMITVEVKNSGNGPVDVKAIGVHGSFTAGVTCNPGSTNEDESDTTATTTTTTTTTTATSVCETDHTDDVVFVPASSTVTGTSCASISMNLVSGGVSENGDHSLTLTAGQCADLTFSGKIFLGESTFVLIPTTTPGQAYEVHVAASQGANLALSCILPASSTSCNAIPQDQH